MSILDCQKSELGINSDVFLLNFRRASLRRITKALIRFKIWRSGFKIWRSRLLHQLLENDFDRKFESVNILSRLLRMMQISCRLIV